MLEAKMFNVLNYRAPLINTPVNKMAASLYTAKNNANYESSESFWVLLNAAHCQNVHTWTTTDQSHLEVVVFFKENL